MSGRFPPPPHVPAGLRCCGRTSGGGTQEEGRSRGGAQEEGRSLTGDLQAALHHQRPAYSP